MLSSVRVQCDWRESKPGQQFWINVEEPNNGQIFADATYYDNRITVTDGITASTLDKPGYGKFLSVTTPTGGKFLFQGPTFSDERYKGHPLDAMDVSAGLMIRAHRDGLFGVWDLLGVLQHQNKPPSRDLSKIHAGQVYLAKFFPSGTVVLSAGADTTLRITDIQNYDDGDEADAILAGHAGGVLGAGFVDRGRNVVSCSRDKTAKLWDVSTQKVIYSFAVSGCANQLVVLSHASASKGAGRDERDFNTEGKLVAVACEDKSAHIFDLRSRHPISRLDTAAASNTLCSQGDFIFLGTDTGRLLTFDLRTNQILSDVKRENSPIVQLSPFDQHRLVVAHGDGALYVWDFNKGYSVLELENPDTDSLLSMCKSGTMVYVGSRQGSCRGYKLEHLL